jgi:hypothetical protein
MSHPDCFGTIFPDMPVREYNKQCKGKVFTVRVEQHGLGATRRYIEADQKEWDECRKCSSYDSCYDLCMARINLIQTLYQLTG